MPKKILIALADAIIEHNDSGLNFQRAQFTPSQLLTLAGFCAEQNPRFNREKWLAYINNEGK